MVFSEKETGTHHFGVLPLKLVGVSKLSSNQTFSYSDFFAIQRQMPLVAERMTYSQCEQHSSPALGN
jgi:hypothetical protein